MPLHAPLRACQSSSQATGTLERAGMHMRAHEGEWAHAACDDMHACGCTPPLQSTRHASQAPGETCCTVWLVAVVLLLRQRQAPARPEPEQVPPYTHHGGAVAQ